MKSKFLVLLFVVAISLIIHVADSETASDVRPDSCKSSASASVGLLLVCPKGDGPLLSDLGLTITVILRDANDNPIAGIPAGSIWVIGCNQEMGLCEDDSGDRRGFVTATAPTDENGQTTITCAIAGGGCDLGGVRVVVDTGRIPRDIVIIGGGLCGVPCIPIVVKSPDLNGSLRVDLVDLAIFGAGYTSPPQPHNQCIDYAAPFDKTDLVDFALFAVHYQHVCF